VALKIIINPYEINYLFKWYTIFKKNDIFNFMGKSIVFVNQKGGVGKTTSAINIGAYIALAGKKVLLVDFDSQGNMSSGVGVSKDKPTVYELIAGMIEPEEAVKHTPVQNLDAISASIDLSGAAIELVDQEKREFFLKKALEPLKSKYDYILIDCPPSLGILTLNGLAAADSVLVPMQCEYFALEGITLLLQTVQKVQKEINPKLTIGGIFFTMYDSRTRLAQDVVVQVKSYFKDVVFSTIIPRNVRLSEAPSHGLPICKYDPECIGAKSYEKLAEEVINRG
jgi:chromosome partitioning protein